MHFENYAPLPASGKRMISGRLTKAIEENNYKEQALIHSGIISVEQAINMYVTKYVQTMRIKNIVDTLLNKIESAQLFETTMKEIISNEKGHDDMVKKLEEAKSKLNWLNMIQNKVNAIIEI